MFCKKCGENIPNDAEFCKHCGVRQVGSSIENILKDEIDIDGEKYIATLDEEKKFDAFTNTPKAENDIVVKNEIIQDKTLEDSLPKLDSFIEEKAKIKKNNKKLFIACAIMAAIIIGIGIFIFVRNIKKTDNSNNLVEQSQETIQTLQTNKQPETQDVLNGYDEKEYSDKSIYKGNFSNGLWDGEGYLKTASGVIYKGTFTKGEVTGEGTIKYTNGDEYIGEYKNGQRNGLGTHFFSNGDKYKGGFAKDLLDGDGEYWYKNGDYFNGQYIEGVKQGYGEYTYVNGGSYKGNYENDLPHGENGIMVYSNKEYYIGNFDQGKRYGAGEYYLTNGDIIYGNWTSNETTGYFRYYTKATNTFEENVLFINGVRQ